MNQESKTLKNLHLKKHYDPCVDGTDVINEVYIPCLSNSIRYDRIAAYFNSIVLQLYSAGLVELYKNGGHARYIFSCETDEIDLQKITSAYDEKMNTLSEELTDDLIDDYNVANLSFLVKHNLAEIKIAFMLKDKTSIMHIKQGIFEDQYGYKVHFDGSGNETPKGLQVNCESFKVFDNFDGPNEYVDIGEKQFESMWNNTYAPDSVYAATPTGLLFEKLCSYSRERLFNNQQEYNSVRFDSKVYVDIDIDASMIMVFDYTKDRYLSRPGGIRSPYDSSKIIEPEKDTYFIYSLTLHDLRDVIPERAHKFGYEVVYSKRAQNFMNEQELYLDKRVKLAESIKKGENKDLWEDSYNNFKDVVNQETLIPLKEEQLLNAYHHYAMKSSMDFSVPGTGKTYISYGLFAYLYSQINKEQQANNIVVFGPLACFKAWKDECVRLFGKDRFNVFDITEHRDNSVQVLKQRKYNVYLFNYQYFENDEKIKLVSKYVLNEKTFLVFDEIHRIKRIGGEWSSGVIRAVEQAPHKPVYKLALTGTPIPNSFVDLHNYIRLLYENDLDSFLYNFSEGKLHAADSDSSSAKAVLQDLYPLFTRTTKNDLKIPPANDDDLSTLSVKPTEDEEQLYEYVYKSYVGSNALVRIIRLIQASSNPELLLQSLNKEELRSISDEGSLFDDDFDVNTSYLYLNEITGLVNKIKIATKTQKAIEQIEKLVKEGKQVLVWCLFLNTIELVKDELKKDGISVITVTGGDNIAERNDRIDMFKNKTVQVLITNPNTLAESVSLHMECHDAVYIEYGYNLTYMLQSKDRIHRVGLPEGTITNYYFAMNNSINNHGTIDLKIYARLKQKEERMKEAIESNDIILTPSESTIEDIEFILNEMS